MNDNRRHNFDQRPEVETRQEARNHGSRDPRAGTLPRSPSPRSFEHPPEKIKELAPQLLPNKDAEIVTYCANTH